MFKDNPHLAALGRLLIAAIFLLSGVGKIASPAITLVYIKMGGLPFPFLAYVVAITIELGGGILLLLGYRSRMVASVMAVFTVVLAITFHRNFADPNQMIHFLKNIAIVGGLLQVMAFGGGKFSIDGRLGKSART
jgi:putative oxidoreductase